MLPARLNQNAEAKVDQTLAVTSSGSRVIRVAHQVNRRVQVDVAAESKLVPCAEQTGEAGVSHVKPVVEVHRIPADTRSALQIQAPRLEWIELGHKEGTAQ